MRVALSGKFAVLVQLPVVRGFAVALQGFFEILADRCPYPQAGYADESGAAKAFRATVATRLNIAPPRGSVANFSMCHRTLP